MPLLSLLLLSAAQTNPVVEILHADLPGRPQALVPGLSGVEMSAIGKLEVAPNGRYTVLLNYLNPLGTDVLVADGRSILFERAEVPWAPGSTLDLIRGGGIASSGEVLASAISGSTRYLARFDGFNWTVELQGGDPVTGLIGVGHGDFYDPQILYTGELAFIGDNLSGAGFGLDQMLFGRDQVLAQIGVTVPAGQLGGTTAPWTLFDQLTSYGKGFRMADGSPNWMATGMIGTGERVLVVNGVVAVQQNYPVPGGGMTQNVLTFEWISMASDGTWWATGINANSREFWAMKDGSVVARTGQPIVPGDARVWSDRISTGGFKFACSGAGVDYLGGHINNQFGQASPIITRNGTEVLLEEFDEIDLDGNGLYDDGVQFRGILDYGAGVDAQGRLLATLWLYDSVNRNFGAAIARISPGAPQLTLNNLTAGQTATIQLGQAVPGHVAVTAFSLAGPGPTSLMTPLGELLLSVGAPYSQTPTRVVDAAGLASWTQPIPASFAGTSVWAQAAAYDAASIKLSNAVAATIQ